MILLLKKAEYDQNVDYRLNRKFCICPYHAHRPLSELHLEFVCCEAYLNILDHLDLDIKITRLARGIPVGGQFDYIDEITLARAFDERTEF